MILAQLKKQRKRHNRYLFYLLQLLPLVFVAIYVFDLYPVNVFEALMLWSGYIAISVFVISYLMSPAQRLLSYIAIRAQWPLGKRLSDWNFLITYRRTFGMAAAYFGVWHFMTYFYFEFDFDWLELWFDLQARQFIFVGLLAQVILISLFITSFNFAKKVLKRHWLTLHSLVHITAVLLLLHIVWESKVLFWYHYMTIGLISMLLIERIINGPGMKRIQARMLRKK